MEKVNKMDKDEVKQAVDETIQEMKNKIEELKQYQNNDEYSGNVKDKINDVTEEVITFLSGMIEHTKNLMQDVKDSNQLQEAMAYMNTKSQEVYEDVLARIEEIKTSPNINEKFSSVKEGLTKRIDSVNKVVDSAIIKLRQNESFMNTIQTIEEKTSELYEVTKQKVTEFTSREDVSEKIEKAKDVTLDISQKAVDKLRDLLKRGD